MATFNKDLSPIDQARIILRNYDKVVAERDELKKENERLNKLVEQKDVLYRNMLAHKEDKNKQSTIEGEYKHLKIQYDKLNEECKKLEGARYSVEVVRQVCGTLKAYSKRLREAGMNIDAIEDLFDSRTEEASDKEPTKDSGHIPQDGHAERYIGVCSSSGCDLHIKREILSVWTGQGRRADRRGNCGAV